MALGNAHSGKQRKNLPYSITQFATLEIEANFKTPPDRWRFAFCEQIPVLDVPHRDMGSPAKSNE